ncbi:MAG: SurA N-terminal domain-containing protein [Siculibacillus sp.]|nr:SurA N-terminal domain-containing protein [Siculibacillus sp.]
MLDVLRRGASTWISKLLLAVLIVSFGIWGIADVFRGFGSNVAFRVGSTEIGVGQFDQIYARELHQLSQRLKRPLGKDEAMKLGVARQIIDKVVTEATISEVAHDLKLGISDQEIATDITQDPSFKGASGAFDRARFVDLLRSNGWNEDYYVIKRREDLLRGQVLDGLSGGMIAPKAMLEAIDQFRNEQRSVRMVSLSAATLGEIAEPAEADLTAFFEARKAAFRAPETRSFEALLLDTESMARASDVTDDDARAEFTRQKTRFTTPEKRRVDQLTFDDAAAATAAAEKIAGGASFSDVAAERGTKLADLDLGLLAKANYLDPKVGDAAFALGKVGDVSPVVQGRFRTAILRLTEIAPGTEKRYEDVAAEIKLELAKRRAETEILARHDQIEDALAGGGKLREIATRFGMTPILVDKMTKEGALASGAKFSATPDPAKLIAAVYESDVGVENETLDLGGKGFVWYAVTAVDPAHDRSLAEVRDRVVAAWRTEEVRKRLGEIAGRIAERVKKGEDIAAVAKEVGFEAETTAEFKRDDRPEKLSPAAVAAAFEGPEGHVASVAGNDDGRIVLQVASVTTPAYFGETEEARGVAERTAMSMQNSMLESWLARVQKDVGVYTHQSNVARVIGRSKD